MRKHLNPVFLVVILAIALLACSTGSQSVRRSHSRISSPREFSETLEFELQPGFKSLVLKLDLSTSEGTVNWIVLDPNGEQQWVGEISAGNKIKESRSFELIEGPWRLAIAGDPVAGEFLMEWTARK